MVEILNSGWIYRIMTNSRDRVDAHSLIATDNAVPLDGSAQLAPASNLLGLSVDGASPSAIQVCY